MGTDGRGDQIGVEGGELAVALCTLAEERGGAQRRLELSRGVKKWGLGISPRGDWGKWWG